MRASLHARAKALGLEIYGSIGISAGKTTYYVGPAGVFDEDGDRDARAEVRDFKTEAEVETYIAEREAEGAS
jgi:hypothetical protein